MTSPNYQQIYSFLVDQSSSIETRAYNRRYPSIRHTRLVPVVTEGNPWAPGMVHFSYDATGAAEFLNQRSQRFPLVDVSQAIHNVAIEPIGIGYDYTLHELMHAMSLNMPLSSRKAEMAVRAYMEKLDDIVFKGHAGLEWDPFAKRAEVPAGDVAQGAAAGTAAEKRLWERKTAQEIIKDINDMVRGVWIQTETVELIDTIALPPDAYGIITERQRSDWSDMTIWEWVKNHNVYTSETGMELNIVPILELDRSGAAGEGRMVGYKNDPDTLCLHVPMPLMFIDPFQEAADRWVVPGLASCGGLEIRLPLNLRYRDGITAAP